MIYALKIILLLLLRRRNFQKNEILLARTKNAYKMIRLKSEINYAARVRDRYAINMKIYNTVFQRGGFRLPPAEARPIISQNRFSIG